MEEHQYITRFSAPNTMDKFPYGTRCKVLKQHGYNEYLQSSKDEENPVWINIGPVNTEIEYISPDE
jgi:predicted component of type VI protein secretion system